MYFEEHGEEGTSEHRKIALLKVNVKVQGGRFREMHVAGYAVMDLAGSPDGSGANQVKDKPATASAVAPTPVIQ